MKTVQRIDIRSNRSIMKHCKKQFDTSNRKRNLVPTLGAALFALAFSTLLPTRVLNLSSHIQKRISKQGEHIPNFKHLALAEECYSM